MALVASLVCCDTRCDEVARACHISSDGPPWCTPATKWRSQSRTGGSEGKYRTGQRAGLRQWCWKRHWCGILVAGQMPQGGRGGTGVARSVEGGAQVLVQAGSATAEMATPPPTKPPTHPVSRASPPLVPCPMHGINGSMHTTATDEDRAGLRVSNFPNLPDLRRPPNRPNWPSLPNLPDLPNLPELPSPPNQPT